MRRLFLVATIVSALLFAAWGAGARPAQAAAGGQMYIANGTQDTLFKGQVVGLPASMPLFLAYQQVGTATPVWVEFAHGVFWTGPDGSTGFWFTPRTDFLPPVMDGSYKIEACADIVCIVFDVGFGNQVVIFQSSVSTNPCLYPPIYNPSLANGGPFVQFSGNTVLPPELAYWQSLQCGFEPWTYSWAPWDFMNAYGFDYYNPALWAPWVWGGGIYDPGLTLIGFPGYPNPNYNPGIPTAPGWWPGYGPVQSGMYPAVQYNQGVLQILGTSLQTPVDYLGNPIPILPYMAGR